MSESSVATTGFAIVPGFLSAAEIAALVDEFTAVAQGDTRNPNFTGLRFAGRDIRKRFAPKIVAAARQATGASFNKLRAGIYYATRLGIELDWHTDTSSYYVYPSFVNLWIPLVKPDRRRSGLDVIDFAAFEARCPEPAAQLRGRGGTRVVVRNGKTVFHDSDRLRYHEVPDPELMDALAVVPELGPGDLLMMRSDVFHRTQDADTDRLAISFRVVDSKAIVTRQMLASMGPAKFNNMARMRSQFIKRFATFEIAGRDALSIREYDAIYRLLEARETEVCHRLDTEALTTPQLKDLIDELAAQYARRS